MNMLKHWFTDFLPPQMKVDSSTWLFVLDSGNSSEIPLICPALHLHTSSLILVRPEFPLLTLSKLNLIHPCGEEYHGNWQCLAILGIF